MRTIFKKIINYLGVTTLGLLLATSCTQYLNVAPEINTKDSDVFGTFLKFQGFMEDVYQCVPDITLPNGGTAENNWNFGLDEGVLTDHNQLNYYWEIGNYWNWQTTSYSPFLGTTGSPNSSSTQGYWRNGWFGIRKCNEAIKNIAILQNGTGTAEQVNFILGQAYFFRAFLHYEILRHWGHIPYIDSVYSATDVIQPTPLSYSDCATRIDADLRTAVGYLPANWDSTATGQLTSGSNALRATKGAAWAIIGENALYAGSPLMATDASSPNNPDSTHFDTAWMTKAAEAFAEVIKLSKLNVAGATGAGGYNLELWQNYQNNFRSNQGALMNGQEVVWTYPFRTYKRWKYGDCFFMELGAWGTYMGPTANYVENFGMANGLPIADPNSGYNGNNPWVNRDPRFNFSIIVDHDQRVLNPKPSYVQYQYAGLYIGGWARTANNSLTGYGYKKFTQVGWNGNDGLWGNNTDYDCPLVRLAGVLLEYAEAVNEVSGPTGTATNLPGLTAIAAVNMVRNRVMVGPYAPTGVTHSDTYLYDFQVGGTPLPSLDAKYTANKTIFRQAIRNERVMELCFEGKRWDDMRRWGIESDLKWRQKYELQFDQGHTYFNKVLYSTSVFEPKMWWLPFPTAQVSLYPAFKQNPGW